MEPSSRAWRRIVTASRPPGHVRRWRVPGVGLAGLVLSLAKAVQTDVHGVSHAMRHTATLVTNRYRSLASPAPEMNTAQSRTAQPVVGSFGCLRPIVAAAHDGDTDSCLRPYLISRAHIVRKGRARDAAHSLALLPTQPPSQKLIPIYKGTVCPTAASEK